MNIFEAILNNSKNRVKFSRKKKCDVCHEVKFVAHECSDCYSNGFDDTANKLYESGKEEEQERIIKLIEKDIELQSTKLTHNFESDKAIEWRLTGMRFLIKKVHKSSERSEVKK